MDIFERHKSDPKMFRNLPIIVPQIWVINMARGGIFPGRNEHPGRLLPQVKTYFEVLS